MKIVNIEVKDGYLYAAIEGEYDYPGSGPFIEIIGHADKAGLKKILVDCRKITGEIPIMERFAAAEMIAQFARLHLKVAFVAGDTIEPDDGFFENVAINRGMNVLATVDYDEAVRWLTK